MDPAALIPTPDSIPVHWGWFQVLLTVTATLHLLTMNVMLGFSVISFSDASRTPQQENAPGKEIADWLPIVVALTINFGVAPLLFLQVIYGHFIYSSSVLMAVYWLSVIPMLIMAYYLLYAQKLRFDTLRAGRKLMSGMVVVLLLVIAFIFTSNMTLMQVPESWLRYFDNRSGMLLHFDDPTLITRYLHFVFSSLAVGGLALALYHDYFKRVGKTYSEERIDLGVRWFVVSTLINTGIGFLFLDSLPDGLFNQTPTRGLFFAIMIYGGLGFAVAAMVNAGAKKVRLAAWLLLASVFLMVVGRELLRSAYLAPYFFPADLPVKSQYSPLLVFLIIFVLGAALILYMFKLVSEKEEVAP